MLKNNNKNDPLVSVIINCHNGQKFLDKSITSVLNQKYKNWEIIFYDNKSTDNSSAILKKYKDSRIKYFRSVKLHHLYKARNIAIQKSKGDYISFLDVDDWWFKNKLQIQINFFKKNPDLDVAYSNVLIFNQKKKTYRIFSKKKLYNGKITQDLINDFRMPILTTIIKKKIFKKIKFNDRYTIIGDFDFFLRLSLSKKIKSIQEPLAYYRVHNSNLTSKRADLTIKELEHWFTKNNKNKDFNSINFIKLHKLIHDLKIRYNINKGNKLVALKEIFKIPLFFSKFKYLLLILINKNEQ